MCYWLERLQPFYGEEGIKKLANSTVAIFGIGGVGGFAVEALARSGVGTFHLIDGDVIRISNLNRQIHSTTKTIGILKTDAAKERILQINPTAIVHSHPFFFTEENSNLINFSNLNFIIDAVDCVKTKVLLAVLAKKFKIEIISSMGTQNKTDPTKLLITDVFSTSYCPLARKFRNLLRKNSVSSLNVVHSTELPILNSSTHASNSFVPASAGLILASFAISHLSAY